jgi:hypothetical protein
MFSEKQRRFNEDCAILESLPEAQKCDICDAFHALVTAVTSALRFQPPAGPPPLPQPPKAADRRKVP